MRRIVQAASAGVGLAAEAIEHHKQKKKSESASPSASHHEGADLPPEYSSVDPREPEDDSDDSDVPEERDDDAWELDEAIEQPANEPSTLEKSPSSPAAADEQAVKEKKTIPVRVERLLAKCAPPPPRVRGPDGRLVDPLPCPVVVPQRRPKNKSRGFVRAYAPVLMEAGIDQDTFIRFLNEWDQSAQADPWITVVFLTAGAVGFFPNPIVMAVTTAVQFAAGTAKELQTRHRSNTFLDVVNEKLFKPRGLYALVMAFDPAATRKIEERSVSLAETISKVNWSQDDSGTSTFSMDSMKHSLQSIRIKSGTTKGEFEMPEAAALVFPKVDEALEDLGAQAMSEEKEKKEEAMATKIKTKFKHAGAFVADYADRRAQADYNMRNPETTLAQTGSRPEFKSKLADPAHPANSGSLLGLFTGGTFDPLRRKRERRFARRERRNEMRVAHGRSARPMRRDATGQRVKRRKGIISRIINQEVLYLLVVNMPTEEEMAGAKAAMNAAKGS